MHQQTLAPFIWNIADLLLGAFRPSEYGRIILPFTVLRRLECVLEPTRDKVRIQYEAMKASGVDMDLILPSYVSEPLHVCAAHYVLNANVVNPSPTLLDVFLIVLARLSISILNV